MSRLKIILKPSGPADSGDHIDEETLGAFAEGRLQGKEKDDCVQHLLRCPQCSETLDDLFEQEPYEEVDEEIASSRSSRKRAPRAGGYRRWTFMALAASVLFLLLLGKIHLGPSPASIAVVALDGTLKEMLLETREKSRPWTGNRVLLLASTLEQRGVRLRKFDTVVLDAPYEPPATKGLFGPEELLEIRVEDGVAHLRVVEKEKDR